MPRLKTPEEMEVQSNGASGETVPEVAGDSPASDAPKPVRTRRPVPEGVTLGVSGTLEPTDPPTRSARRGRKVSEGTVAAIETMRANPGQWYFIGLFQSASSPTKDSAFGRAGIRFANTRREDGLYERKGMYAGEVNAEG